MTSQGLAVVTGASSGIGYELARCAVKEGFDLIVVAEDAQIEAAATVLGNSGTKVEPVQADLSTEEGVRQLLVAIGERPVEALVANAGIGLGDEFLNQDLRRALQVVDLNIRGTLILVHEIGRAMRDNGHGRILVTGSIAGFMPGSYQAVYNGTKAFLDSFAYALRDELSDTGVTVTCLMPGATDTDFFREAGMENTPVGEDAGKADPADVAAAGFHAMMAGDSGVMPGFMNRVQTVFAGLLPDTVVARMHRRLAKPEPAH